MEPGDKALEWYERKYDDAEEMWEKHARADEIDKARKWQQVANQWADSIAKRERQLGICELWEVRER